jgi:hypothetical protein
MLDAATESLANALKMNWRSVRCRLQAAFAADWRAEPFSRGAYSCSSWAIGANGLAAPVANTVFFAGEATDTEGNCGTMQGAMQQVIVLQTNY